MDRDQWLDIFSSASWQSSFEDFLESGGDISAAGDQGSTLIHYAIDAENYGAINWLIARGADINATDNMGWSALHYAVDSDIDVAIQANMPVEFRGARFMISAGINPDIQDVSGYTARDVAAEYGATVLDRYDELLN